MQEPFDVRRQLGARQLAPCVYFSRHVSARPRRERITGRATERTCNLWRVHDGSLQIDGGSRRTTLRPGEVVLTDAGTAVVAARDARFDRIACDLIARDREFYAGAYHVDIHQPPHPAWRELFGFALPVPLPRVWSRRGCELVDDLLAESWRTPWSQLWAHARLHAWLVDLAADLAPPPGDVPHDHDLLRRARDAITTGYRRGLTVTDVAAELHVSRSHLQALFQGRFGYGPGEALARERLRRARELLRVSDEPIDHLARRIGYAGARPLARAFHRRYGETPAAYRRRARSRGPGQARASEGEQHQTD